MYGLVSKATNELVAIVERTDGYNLNDFDVVNVTGDPGAWKWDKQSRALVPRDPSALELVENALGSDPRWTALRTATPAQVAQWMQTNVTTLAEARSVLVLLALAVQRLARRTGAT